MTDALAPFAAALLLAYLLEPIARRLTGLGLPRAFSSVVAILVGLVVVVSMVSIGVPVVSHEIGKLQARLPDLIATLYARSTHGWRRPACPSTTPRPFAQNSSTGLARTPSRSPTHSSQPCRPGWEPW